MGLRSLSSVKGKVGAPKKEHAKSKPKLAVQTLSHPSIAHSCLPLALPLAFTVFLQNNPPACVLTGLVTVSGVTPGASPILPYLSRIFSVLPWIWHLIMVSRLNFHKCILPALTCCPGWDQFNLGRHCPRWTRPTHISPRTPQVPLRPSSPSAGWAARHLHITLSVQCLY